MKKVEVSKEVIEELNEVMAVEIFDEVLAKVTANKAIYSNLYNFLFGGTAYEADKAQDILEGFLGREIELVEKKEGQYVVWLKGSKSKKGWASFMHVEDDNTIDISYDSLFDMAKGNPGFHFSKEKAFKLRDTGYFEIERVDE